MTHKEDIKRLRNSYQQRITRQNITEIIDLYKKYTNNLTKLTDSDVEIIYLMVKNR